MDYDHTKNLSFSHLREAPHGIRFKLTNGYREKCYKHGRKTETDDY